MTDDRYNSLKKKYNALLEENESLRAKIRELESQQNISTFAWYVCSVGFFVHSVCVLKPLDIPLES